MRLFRLFHSILFLSLGSPALAQEPTPYLDTINTFLAHQHLAFPQEKIHLHTDKPNYLAGEKIWFRAYLVDAMFHKQANASRYVYAELINPLDSVVCRVKVAPDSLGYFYGHIPLHEGLAEGNYSLRAYTMYMKNQGEDYFFRKSVPIIDPLSTSFEIIMDYAPDERRSTLSFRFVEMYTRKAFIPENPTVRLKGQDEQRLKFQSDSVASFTFRNLPKGEPRVITLRMNYMGKIYTKYLHMPSDGDDYDVSFHPEGGNLLAGVDNVLAFKCIDANGLSKVISGQVLDAEGNFVTGFGTRHAGMGSFFFNPEKGRSYHAVCTDESGRQKRFDLPGAVDDYVGLHLATSPEQLAVSVNKTPGFSTGSRLYLLALLRGYPIYSAEWDFSFGEVSFGKNSLPSGLYQFILIDGEKNILSERLFFNYLHPDEPSVEFSTAGDNYGARERIVSSVKITDSDGTPLPGNFSVAVTDDTDIVPDSSNTIISTLFLTSDLRGYIENPAYYFSAGDRKAAAGLDLLMMTQGWKRYALSETVRGNLEYAATAPETTQIIRGKVSGALTSTGKDAMISVLALHDEFSDVMVGQADDNGRFEISGFEYPDSTRFVFQARSRKDKGNVFIEIEDEESSRYPLITSGMPGSNPDYGQISEDYILKADQKYLYENGMRVVNLEEITVTARRGRESGSRFYSPVSSSRIITSEEIDNLHLSSMSSLLMRLGLQVTAGRVQLRGNNVLTVIDDIPYEDYDILSLNIYDIDDIFVMKDTSAAVFGNLGGNGAIVVTTKRGTVPGNTVNKNISELVELLGFQRPLEFYSPKYDVENNRNVPDLRTTIFWKPDVTVGNDGEVQLDFYSADAPTTYSVVIEGITGEGAPVRKVATIRRNL